MFRPKTRKTYAVSSKDSYGVSSHREGPVSCFPTLECYPFTIIAVNIPGVVGLSEDVVLCNFGVVGCTKESKEFDPSYNRQTSVA